MRRPIILSLPLVIGCGPGEAPRLETEHITFHGELDGACGALGTLYEREVARIEHGLGRGLLEPVDVYVGLDEIDRRCPTDTSTSPWVAGCMVSDTEIVTTLGALSYHLVDATRLQHGVHGTPFVENALAPMLGLARPAPGYVVTLHPGDDAIAPQLAYGWSDEALVEGVVAMHFLHWMEQAYGLSAFHAWLWSDAVVEGTNAEAAFAEATGQTLAVAEERWDDEAERDAVFDGFCHGLPAPPLPASGLVAEGAACCDAPGVEQFEPPLLNVAQQCFTVSADTVVDAELLAGDGELVLRPDGCTSWADVSPLVLRSGEATTVTLTPCRWKAMVVGPEHCEAGGEVRYAITPR